MISKLVKTAKFMYGWLDWSLLYPLWQTQTGREQIIRYGLGFIKKHPEKLKEIQAMVDKIMGEEMLNAVMRSMRAKKEAPEAKEPDDRPRDITDLKDRLGLRRPGTGKKS